MLNAVYTDVRARMEKTVDAAKGEFGTIRTGRATPALLDRITITAYGSQMPINQLATIAVPQPRLLVIRKVFVQN